MTSRSDFLKQAAGAAAVVAGASAGAGAFAGPAAAAFAGKKGYDYWVTRSGLNVGRLVDASGGDPRFDVVVADFDADGNPDKVLGPPSWSPFTIQFGSNMSQAFYDWVNGAFDTNAPTDGAIIATDLNGFEVARRSFTGAQITSFAMPALHKGQSIPALTVKFEAASVSDDTPDPTNLVTGARQKAWLCSAFKFACPGLPPNRIASVDSFTWRHHATAADPFPDPPNLTCLIDPAGAPAWTDWYENFALGGDSSDERDATLSVWGSTHTTPLFSWSFQGLGIRKLMPASPSSSSVVAEMYVERAHCQCNHL